MPELPEVETVVRDLRPLVAGRTIRAVRHGAKKLREPWKPAWDELVADMRIESLRRRGKWIVLELIGRSQPRLLVHLGMSGRLTTAPQESTAHRHVVFELDDGSELQFFDPRRFGSVTCHESEAALAEVFKAKKLGPEPKDLKVVEFSVAVCNTVRTLKAVLLDQRVVAGVGNIYANEVCFLAGIHPQRPANTLTRTECQRLVRSIKAVIDRAIRLRGTTLPDEGFPGGRFQSRLSVYGRAGEPCHACAAPIECIRLSGRASHYCPRCQPRG